jgi:hypothetical protein
MWYIALIIRLLIIATWIFMIVQNPVPQTPPFCSWAAFILIGVYLQLLSVFWPKAMLCPFFDCRDWACKK